MPELPEVETTVRGIASITGKRIKQIWSDWEKSLFVADKKGEDVELRPATAEAYARMLTNREVVGVARRGKYILIHISSGYLILIHQKMTGHLLLGKWRLSRRGAVPNASHASAITEKVNRYIHFVITFRDGTMLGFSDVRKFGRVILGKETVVRDLPALRALGPDPLAKDFTARKLAARLARKSPIKKVLLDQTVIAGIGNIYSDEILFRANIHPLRSAHETVAESKKILKVMQKILREGIRLGGASKTNYRKPDGEKGGFMETCLIYGRAGQPCFTCKTIIQKLKIAGRTASFCPKCQRIEF